MSYLDSHNLDYEENRGRRYIRSSDLGSIGVLINDLNADVRMSQAGG